MAQVYDLFTKKKIESSEQIHKIENTSSISVEPVEQNQSSQVISESQR